MKWEEERRRRVGEVDVKELPPRCREYFISHSTESGSESAPPGEIKCPDWSRGRSEKQRGPGEVG